MMEVVVPLRRMEPRAPVRLAREPARLIRFVLEHEMDLPAGQRRPSALGDLGDDVLLAIVEDRMDGVEPEAVEVIFLEPVQRVVDEEVPHRPRSRARRN